MKTKYIILLAIFFLAVVKYFRFLSVSPFEADQEYLALSADEILHGKLTLIGAPTSVGGMFISPLYNYLVAFLMFVFKGSPLVINTLSSIWAVATIMALYCVGKKFFSDMAGIFSAILALFSSKFLLIADNPPLVSLLPLLVLTSLYISTKPKSLARNAALGLLVGLALNSHFSGVYLLPLILTEGIHGIVFMILPIVPLILFEARHNWFITGNAIRFMTDHSGAPTGIWHRLNAFISSQAQIFQTDGINLLLMAVVVLVIFWMIRRKAKINRWFAGSFFLPLIFFLIYPGQLLPYYAAIAWPSFLLVAGDLLSKAFDKSSFIRIGILIIMVFFGLSQTKIWSQFSAGRGVDKKLAALRYIKSSAGDSKYYFSKTIEPAADSGFTYLTKYVGINSTGNISDMTYTIVAPFNWQGIQPDVRFGDFGIVLPKNKNQ